MIGTDKQVIEALKVQRNQYADDCAELKAAWDAVSAALDAANQRMSLLEQKLMVYADIDAGQQIPEDGGHWSYPFGKETPQFHVPTPTSLPGSIDEHGVAAP